MAKRAHASSRREKLVRRNGEDILRHSKNPETIARLKRLAEMPDSQIDFSDIPEATAEQLARMAPLRDYLEVRHKKIRVTARVDKDVVAWLKSQGEGYQTRMNDILRAAMRASIAKGGKKAR